MQLRAYAKVNLTLEVLARRADGFHEIASVMQTVELADEVTLAPAAELALQCDTDIPPEENLALRAARLLRGAAGVDRGTRITLRKRIPMAAGLGGGSSDAAAVLLGLDGLWGLGMGKERLAALAAKLGSDVPFFLWGGTALASGRGEAVSPLPPLRPAWLVLATPPVTLPNKTATLYRGLRPEHFTRGEATRRLTEAIRSGKPLADGMLCNVFQSVAPEAFPELSRWMDRFQRAGAAAVHLSGSGPTLFALVAGQEAGERLRARCAAKGMTAHVVRTVTTPV